MNWFSTYHVHHRVAARFREGRAFLLGDAAHVHSPVGGQGMNTGIGDAVNLAWKLAAVLNGSAADSLLDTYEPERIGFARRLVATTDRVFTLVTAQGPIARRVRTRLVPLVAPLLFRLAAVRRFLFRTVSQIGVNYRDSPLSEGAAGSVQGGDRLPWVETAPNEDNFAPLTSLAWQVHVYGEPPRGVAEACAELRLPLHSSPGSRQCIGPVSMRGRLYLVRPDGYVALADPERRSGAIGPLFHESRLAGRSSTRRGNQVRACAGQARIARCQSLGRWPIGYREPVVVVLRGERVHHRVPRLGRWHDPLLDPTTPEGAAAWPARMQTRTPRASDRPRHPLSRRRLWPPLGRCDRGRSNSASSRPCTPATGVRRSSRRAYS